MRLYSAFQKLQKMIIIILIREEDIFCQIARYESIKLYSNFIKGLSFTT